MSDKPIGHSYEIVVQDTIASSKNRRRIYGRGKFKKSLPSVECEASIKALRAAARDVLMDREGADFMDYVSTPFDSQDQLEITYIHNLDDDSVFVSVEKIGEVPSSGKKGTRNDIHGKIETIADALEGVIYPDDRYVERIQGWRERNGLSADSDPSAGQ